MAQKLKQQASSAAPVSVSASLAAPVSASLAAPVSVSASLVAPVSVSAAPVSAAPAVRMSLRPKWHQWALHELVQAIEQKQICKPRCQRKKTWQLLSATGDESNCLDYIKFLYETCSTVEAITFARFTKQESKDVFSAVDGNNRLRAITIFCQKPLSLFKENFALLRQTGSPYAVFVAFLESIPYAALVTLKSIERYIKNKLPADSAVTHIWQNDMDAAMRDYIEDEFESVVMHQLLIDKTHHFHLFVTINLVVFTNPDEEQLAYIYHSLNKNVNPMSKTDILAATLLCATHFSLDFDPHLQLELEQELEEYYVQKNADEILQCYAPSAERMPMNGTEFIIAFQNYCARKYPDLVPVFQDKHALMHNLFGCKNLFYTLSAGNFTTENIRRFVSKVEKVLITLQEAMVYLHPATLDLQNFKKDVNIKFHKSTNASLVLFAGILRLQEFVERGQLSAHQLRDTVCKVILYHVLVTQVEDKETRDLYALHDLLNAMNNHYIEQLTLQIRTGNLPLAQFGFGNKVTAGQMRAVLQTLVQQYNKPCLHHKKPKRRVLPYTYRILLSTYYNAKVPYTYTKRKQNADHVFPYSSDWMNDVIDLDRLGNLLIFDEDLNKARKNTSIQYYYDKAPDLMKCLDYPSLEEYNTVILHGAKSLPLVKNVAAFNTCCSALEEVYVRQLLQQFFPNE